MWRIVLLALSLFACSEEREQPSPPPLPPPPESCEETQPPAQCEAGVAEFEEALDAQHIDEGSIEYEEYPPSSGDHRSQWARWGEYSSLPAERWLHNLEHGGIAFLYNPCAEPALIEELRDYARALQGEGGAPFRWVLTPAPELPTAIAVIAWEWRYLAECLRRDEVDEFIERVYRRAPEDIAVDGAYSEGWIGR